MGGAAGNNSNNMDVNTFMFKLLFPSGVEGINPEVVEQGSIGDCQAIAAISSLAGSKLGKELIISYFEVEGSEYIKVTLPGAVTPISVSIIEIIDNELYASSTDKGLWVPVLEKAIEIYIKQCGTEINCHASTHYKYFIKKMIPESFDDSFFLERVGGDFIINLLTGVESDWVFISEYDIELDMERDVNKYYLSMFTNEECFGLEMLHNDLIYFSRISVILTAGVKSSDNSGRYICELLDSNNQYSILGYDQDKRMVKIRNPHGCSDILDMQTGDIIDHVDDGVFILNLKDFKYHFDTIYYSNKSPYTSLKPKIHTRP